MAIFINFDFQASRNCPSFYIDKTKMPIKKFENPSNSQPLKTPVHLKYRTNL